MSVRTEAQVDEFRAELDQRNDIGDETKWIYGQAFEAGVPRTFWKMVPKDVEGENREAFKRVVMRYVERLHTARRKGYGLLLSGDNGTGKTMFGSWVLMSAIRIGWNVYYTTAPELEADMQRGFRDREVSDRLEWLLGSDFVFIDELGKEKHREGESWFRGQIERVLKRRYDDNAPTLLATNGAPDSLATDYGASIADMIDGKFQIVTLAPGSFRARARAGMIDKMGYGG